MNENEVLYRVEDNEVDMQSSKWIDAEAARIEQAKWRKRIKRAWYVLFASLIVLFIVAVIIIGLVR